MQKAMTTQQINEFLDDHSFRIEPSLDGLALWSVSGSDWWRQAIVADLTEAYQKAAAIVAKKESLKPHV